MNEKILQRRHEELFVQQRQKYENSIAQLDESLGKANEEKNKEIEIYLGEKTRLEEVFIYILFFSIGTEAFLEEN